MALIFFLSRSFLDGVFPARLLPRGENSPSKHAHCARNPIVVGRVCPERAASILHPQPGALGTDAPYLEVHGEESCRLLITGAAVLIAFIAVR